MGVAEPQNGLSALLRAHPEYAGVFFDLLRQLADIRAVLQGIDEIYLQSELDSGMRLELARVQAQIAAAGCFAVFCELHAAMDVKTMAALLCRQPGQTNYLLN